MNEMTLAQLRALMPKATGTDAWLPVLNAAMRESAITTPLSVAAFLANVAVESGQLSTTSENLNYSADGLANTWPARFARRAPDGSYLLTQPSTDFGRTTPGGRKVPNDAALALHRQPERIANVVYANRMGNGDEASGDGWLRRGAGLIQLTGATNQCAAAAHFGVEPGLIGDWLRSMSGAARSAAWYFASHGACAYADKGDFDGVCDVINIGRKTEKVGDAIGYAERFAFFVIARRVFNC
jgi:putative chitinase